jgi:UDP-galactopyranose mutase
VIDERCDLGLLQALAQARPEWEIVLVGPVVKIDPGTLPRCPNLHYLGMRAYADLPGYLAGWDVCLLPFALNEATRFISPTKTLEYMAAERPIVSTPITDVAEPYGDVVYLAHTHQDFIEACERALEAPVLEKRSRVQRMRAILARTSWDSTGAAMEAELERLLKQRQGRPQSAIAPEPRPGLQRSSEPIVVIGAGPTGLSAAYHLGTDSLLVEQADRVGGWCRSLEDSGFTFDYAGHIMFSNDPYVHEMYRLLLGDNVHWQDREAWIYSKNVYTRYPFQGSLYGLPPAVIKECVVGAIEARFGPLKARTSGAKDQPADYTGPERRGMFEPLLHNSSGKTPNGSMVRRRYGGPERRDHNGKKGPPQNFEEFIYRVWGHGIAKHFAIPYNEKLWAVPLREMETSWLGGRVPLPDLEDMIEGALSPAPKPMGPNARFGYPFRGGFQALMNGFLPHLRGELRLHTRAVRLAPSTHMVTFQDGSRVRYDHLLSTMPLPELVRLCGDEAPSHLRAAAKRLRHVSVRCVNIGVGRQNLTEKHWIYYPEQTVFHRIFVQGNASPFCNPPGGFGLTCEITYSPTKPLPCEGDALIRKCIEDCVRVGFFNANDPIWAANQVDLPVAYVVYDHDRAANVDLIRAWMLERDIILAGRYSEWEYYNSDHAFIAGKKAAEQIRARQEERLDDGEDRAASSGQRGYSRAWQRRSSSA